MSDVAFRDFSAEIAGFSLPELERLQSMVAGLIRRRRERRVSALDGVEVPEERRAFFDAVGRISFDEAAVESLREESVL